MLILIVVLQSMLARASPVASLWGVVEKSPSGSGVPYALVRFNSGGACTATCTTEDSGYYRLWMPAGTYDIEIWAEGCADYHEQGVSLPNGSNHKDFCVQAEARITGRVTKSDGTTPLGDIAIAAEDASGNGKPSVTEADGTYVIERLAAGTYTVFAVDGDYRFPEITGVQVSAGQTTSGINIAATDDGVWGILRGHSVQSYWPIIAFLLPLGCLMISSWALF